MTTELIPDFEEAEYPIPSTAADPLAAAINRLAQAVEQLTVQNGPRQSMTPFVAPAATPAPLAALPPVQTVAARPACPFHGAERVAPSTNGKGGFYCQAKPGIGQPNTNPKGYCTWHT